MYVCIPFSEIPFATRFNYTLNKKDDFDILGMISADNTMIRYDNQLSESAMSRLKR